MLWHYHIIYIVKIHYIFDQSPKVTLIIHFQLELKDKAQFIPIMPLAPGRWSQVSWNYRSLVLRWNALVCELSY